eukprot:2130198-Prymnesium_polylepis.1
METVICSGRHTSGEQVTQESLKRELAKRMAVAEDQRRALARVLLSGGDDEVRVVRVLASGDVLDDAHVGGAVGAACAVHPVPS